MTLKISKKYSNKIIFMSQITNNNMSLSTEVSFKVKPRVNNRILIIDKWVIDLIMLIYIT